MSIRVTCFWKSVNKTANCWLWTGKLNAAGYGVFTRKTIRAHRFSYELHIGSIPKNMNICHSCDVRACVNPKHLFVGTQKQNMQDMTNKGRRASGDKTSNKGVSNPRAKLTEFQIIEMRSLRGIPQAWLAKHYGVSPSTVQAILKYRNWRHLS